MRDQEMYEQYRSTILRGEKGFEETSLIQFDERVFEERVGISVSAFLQELEKKKVMGYTNKITGWTKEQIKSAVEPLVLLSREEYEPMLLRAAEPFGEKGHDLLLLLQSLSNLISNLISKHPFELPNFE